MGLLMGWLQGKLGFDPREEEGGSLQAHDPLFSIPL